MIKKASLNRHVSRLLLATLLVSFFLTPIPTTAAAPGVYTVFTISSLDGSPSGSDLLGEFFITENIGGCMVEELTFEQSGDSTLSTATAFELHYFDPGTGTSSLIDDKPVVLGNTINFSGLGYAIPDGDTPRLQLRGNTVETRNVYSITLTDMTATTAGGGAADSFGPPMDLGSQLFPETTPNVTVEIDDYERTVHEPFLEMLRINLSTDKNVSVTGMTFEEAASETGWEPSEFQLNVDDDLFPAVRDGNRFSFSGLTLNLNHADYPELVRLSANTMEAYDKYRLSLVEIATAAPVNFDPALPLTQEHTNDFPSRAFSAFSPGFDAAVIRASDSLLLDFTVTTEGPAVDFNNLTMFMPDVFVGAELYDVSSGELLNTASDMGTFSGAFMFGRSVGVSETESARLRVVVDASAVDFGSYELNLLNVASQDVGAGTLSWSSSMDDFRSDFDITLVSGETSVTTALISDFDTEMTKSSSTILVDFTITTVGPDVAMTGLTLFATPAIGGLMLQDMSTGTILSVVSDSGTTFADFGVPLTADGPARLGLVADTSGLDAGTYNINILNASGVKQDGSGDAWLSTLSDFRLDVAVQLNDEPGSDETPADDAAPQLRTHLSSSSPSGSQVGDAEGELMIVNFTSDEFVTVDQMQFTLLPDAPVSDLRLVNATTGALYGTGGSASGAVFFNSIAVPVDGTATVALLADTTAVSGTLRAVLGSIRTIETATVTGIPLSGNTLTFPTDETADGVDDTLPPTEDETPAPAASDQEVYDGVMSRERSRQRNADTGLLGRVSGHILLQVEEHGEAWYVDPIDNSRHYLQNGASAYGALRDLGLGISNADLKLIPIGLESRFQVTDTDGDGLADQLEDGLGTDRNNPDTDGDGYNDGDELMNGYNPLGSGRWSFSATLVDRLRGRILLQVEEHGEAWYVNPADGRRYYMKDGDFAYEIMRFLGLGITNNDLATVPLN